MSTRIITTDCSTLFRVPIDASGKVTDWQKKKRKPTNFPVGHFVEMRFRSASAITLLVIFMSEKRSKSLKFWEVSRYVIVQIMRRAPSVAIGPVKVAVVAFVASLHFFKKLHKFQTFCESTFQLRDQLFSFGISFSASGSTSNDRFPDFEVLISFWNLVIFNSDAFRFKYRLHSIQLMDRSNWKWTAIIVVVFEHFRVVAAILVPFAHSVAHLASIWRNMFSTHCWSICKLTLKSDTNVSKSAHLVVFTYSNHRLLFDLFNFASLYLKLYLFIHRTLHWKQDSTNIVNRSSVVLLYVCE